MEKKELKGCLKMMIGMIVISSIILYCTCFFGVQARNFYEAESYAIKRYSVMDAEK